MGNPSKFPKNKKRSFPKGSDGMNESEILNLVNGESIRIRFTEQMKKRLFQEKERTGKSVSQIVRQSAGYEY